MVGVQVPEPQTPDFGPDLRPQRRWCRPQAVRVGELVDQAAPAPVTAELLDPVILEELTSWAQSVLEGPSEALSPEDDSEPAQKVQKVDFPSWSSQDVLPCPQEDPLLDFLLNHC